MQTILTAGLVLAALLCAGCASVTQGTTHALRIETLTSQGEQLDGVDCTLANDHGTTSAKSGTDTVVRRSSRDLEIRCVAAGQPDAEGRLVSRANAGLAGNIVLGGAVGAVIDHNTGAGYTYPGWVRLVFGQFHIFDRRDEREGSAMAGPGAPLPRATPGQVATREAAAVDASIVQGLALEYRITNRVTRETSTVVLRADRVDANEASFNGGSRVEDAAGAVVRMNAALIGELDQVTPPGGWLRSGRAPTGQWKVRHDSVVPGSLMSYDLDATSEGDQVLQVEGRQLRVQRVSLRGWARNAAGLVPVRAAYEARAWVSPELRRVVRFEARSRASGNAGGGYFHIDESTELVRISRD